ncbi:glycosyltransferase family 4 protein [Marinigracilibium pacificum]|uniref:Glycosyltransferase family 4 protein n=1 Tax=Marinigracilibium pacificum TaxID=2729599 RepID=A0A848IYR7_9BACT|nr:glycosyltransferase family 4 protein [Marinigracilibium pacificum]NMM47384.1 glycosyltransferase family 4 protein [Marinigracilibium pacificum]
MGSPDLKAKRIGIVVNSAWNVINFRKGIILNLLDRGCQVFAFVPEDNYADDLRKLGVEVINTPLSSTGVNPVNDLRYLNTLYKQFKEIKPDVLLQYTIKPNIYGAIAASRLGIPVINNVSGLGTMFLGRKVFSSIAFQLYKQAFKNVPLVFFQNESDRRFFLINKMTSRERSMVIPGSGVDVNYFKPLSKPVKSKSLVFLMIARLIIEKGIYEFAYAARRLKEEYPNVEFQILGAFDPSHPRSVKSEDLEYWVKNSILNYYEPVNDVRPHIMNCDAIVLPSYREGTSKTLLEGASMGRPLIATDVPGCREVVRNNTNGLLCKAGDSESLYFTLKQFIELSSAEREQMGIESRKFVEGHYSEDLVINTYLSAIDRLTS